MSSLISQATTPVADMVRGVTPDQLRLPTPCPDFDVRRLLNHLLYWGPSLEGAARKVLVPPPDTPEAERELPAGWQPELLAYLAKLTESWSDPAAWTGTTMMGGPTEMPAGMVGGMIVGEVVLHGWDLAEATGQKAVWDEEVLAYVHKELTANVQMGRDMGMFAPEVPVPEDAPLLDRVLGLSGRTPST
ncbi:TIGR03086 family metal-binding protein [Kibdelosporangium lantanae]